MIKPTQADRDAAREVYRRFRYGATPAVQQRIQEGLSDGFRDHDPILQFIASHAEQARLQERERCARIAYRICAETRHVTLGDRVQDAIRKGETE